QHHEIMIDRSGNMGAAAGIGAGAAAGAATGGGGGYYSGAFGSPYQNRLGTKVFRIQRSQPWFGWHGNPAFDLFHQRAPQVRWERRQATVLHFHRSLRAQQTNGSLKPHKLVRKMLPDQKPMQSLGARSAGAPLINRSADEVQVAPTSVIEKAEPTFGTAPVNR